MRRQSIIHATAALLLASCNPITIGCTLIGCHDGLVVEFAAPPTGAYTVEAWSEIEVNPRVYECAAGEICPPVLFPQFRGQAVTVRVTTVAGTRTQEFTGVQYEPQYPNGPDCGAACEQATVTFPS
jgi:hypothetical protein